MISMTLAILLSAMALPRESASLVVRVSDAQDGVIPVARVLVYPQATSSPISRTTDSRGVARVPVPGGTFLVEVDAAGFRTASRVVTIQEGQEAVESFSLEVAGVSSTVVVTASNAPESVDQIAKAFTVVEGREILDRNEYALPGILSTVPGVQVRSVGGPGQASQLRVRGLRPDATAILIDGMRFRDASTTQGDATSFLSNLNFISADRVEMLRGSGSSLYGTNAAAGVVNIVTDQGGGRAHGTLQAEGGTLGFLRGRAQAGGGVLNERLKYSAGVVHLNVTRGVDGNDRARSTGGQAFLRYDVTPQTAASARFFGSDDFSQVNISPTSAGVPAANIPTGVVVPAIALDPAEVQRLLNRQTVDYGTATYIPGRDDPDSRRASRFHATAIKLDHTISPALGVQASYQRVLTRRVFTNGPAGIGSQPLVTTYTRLVGTIDTADLRANLEVSRWNHIAVGYEFERERYADLQDNNLTDPQRIRTETSIRQNAYAAYFQDQLKLFRNRLQLSLSGRAQVFGVDSPEFHAAGIKNNYELVVIAPPPKALTGDVSLSYLLNTSGTKLRAHAGNAYRAPALFERFGGGFSNTPSTGQLVFSPWGDPSLQPDRYNSVDAGIDQYLVRDRVRISSTYFYTRVATITAFDTGTVIKAATDLYGRTSGYINGSGGLSRGVELSVESRPTGSLTLNGSYTYTRANLDRAITVPGFWRVLGVPRHSVSFVVTRRLGTRATVVLDFVGKNEMFGNFTAAGSPRAFRYPGTTKTDLSSAIVLRQTETGGLKLNTRIENLFNETFYDLGWLIPRRSFVTGLSYQF